MGKQIWKHCNNNNNKTKKITLGRIPLLSLQDVNDEYEDDAQNTTWKYHYPFTGKLPCCLKENNWTWPVLFIYPTHSQCDFIEYMDENEMIALRLATMFPELEECTDHNNNNN